MSSLNASDAFDISDWRDSVKTRRDLIRSMIIRTTLEGEQLEPMLAELKDALRYYTLDDHDRNLFRHIVYDIRTVVGGWSLLAPEERKRFGEGKGAPSMLAAKIRKQS